MIQVTVYKHLNHLGVMRYWLRLWNDKDEELVINIGKNTFEKVIKLGAYELDSLQEGGGNVLDD